MLPNGKRQKQGRPRSYHDSRCQDVSDQYLEKWCEYLHEFLEHIVDRDHDSRNGVSRKHPNDGNWSSGKATI
jgi:hypothetical protein